MILFTFNQSVKVGDTLKVAHVQNKTVKSFKVIEILGQVGDYTKVKVA
jgi:hypothetical protein